MTTQLKHGYLWPVALTLALIAWALSAGLLCGAEPPSFVASTDGQVIILRPTMPADTGYVLRLTPGQFSGILVTAKASQPVVLDWSGAITFGDVPPMPEPGPQPKPKPDPPTPVVKPVAIYLIYESGDLTPAMARVRDALAWKKAADAAGIRWLAFDDESGEKKFPNATKRAREAGLPAVVLIDKSGVPEVLKAPETPEAMEKLVREKGGK